MKKLIILLSSLILVFSIYIFFDKKIQNEDFFTNRSKSYTKAIVTLADDNIQIEGNGLYVEENTITIVSGGVYEITGTLTNGQIIIDVDDYVDVELVLINANIFNLKNSPIYCKNVNNLFITVPEGTKTTLSDAKEYEYVDNAKKEPDATIFNETNLNIGGTGELIVISNSNNAIYARDLIIEDGIFEIKAAKKGLKAKETINIGNGNFNINSDDDAIHSNVQIQINDGIFNIKTKDDAIHADKHLNINGGKIDIKTCYEGLESFDILITNGEININSEDDGISVTGDLNPKIEVTGGNINILSKDDCIDVNDMGTMYFSGGTIVASTPEYEDNQAVIGFNGIFYLNGGTLFGAGNSDTFLVPIEKSTKPTLGVYFDSKIPLGTKIEIKKDDGTLIYSYKTKHEIQYIEYGAPELEIGKTYKIIVGDDKEIKITLNAASTVVFEDETYTKITNGYVLVK